MIFQNLVLKGLVITKYPESKDKKTRSCVILLDRSSSLVWMTHSHCVREQNSPQRSWVQIPSGPPTFMGIILDADIHRFFHIPKE